MRSSLFLLGLLTASPAARAFPLVPRVAAPHHDSGMTTKNANTNTKPLSMSSVVDPPATTTAVENKVLWSPSEDSMKETAMYRFLQASLGDEETTTTTTTTTPSYEDLWKWSVEHSDEFWTELLDFLDVVYEGSTAIVKEGTTMPDVTYFPDVKLNFAENMLKHGAPASPLRHEEALVSISEARRDDDQRWTFQELRDDAARVAAALRKLGVTEKDACGAYLPNIGEAVVAMLGTTSTGSVWTSSSPDFGAQAVADRFSQVAPKVLFVTDGYVSKAKAISLEDKVQELVASLPSLERIVIIPLLPAHDDDDNNDETDTVVVEWNEQVQSKMMSWDDFLASGSREDGSAPEPEYTRVPFAHPQFVLYSSGTTGTCRVLVFVMLHIFFASQQYSHLYVCLSTRHAQIHCPRRRQHPPAARQGIDVAFRCASQGSHVLFHNLRLDDVELDDVFLVRGGRGRRL